MATAETYSRHYAKALRLLERFGGVASISRTTTSSKGDCPFNPSGTDPDGNPCRVTSTHDVTLLETGSTVEERSSSGSTILDSKLVGLLACAEDFTPSSSDRLLINGRTISITELSRVGPSPSGQPIVYEVVGQS